MRLFGKEQVKVLLHEDWGPDPHPAYLSVLEFLELEYEGRKEVPVANRVYQMRSRRFGKAMLSPPRPMVVLVGAAKRVTSKYQLGVGARLRAWNRVQQTTEPRDVDFLAELDSRWNEDIETLERLLARDLSAWKADN